MTDGRVYTLDDEIDVAYDDLQRARRRLNELLTSVCDGRACNEPEINQGIRRLRVRVAGLERELAELCAEQVAAAEGFRS